VGIVVVTIPLLYLFLLPGWFIALLWSASYRATSLAVASVMTHVTTMLLVIIGAVNAPVKTTDHVLGHMITLPQAKMTLAEIGGDPDGLPPDWRPRLLHVFVPADEASQEIAFRSTTISLQEFVNTVEAQSTLRHRFGHCGNGSTILWGGDCSFGLHLRRPSE
jgi:hypothetical protein